jgi:hypothetical protein
MISKMRSGLQIAMVEKNTIVVINISERKFFDVKLHNNFILCEQDKIRMQAEDLQLDSKF